MSREYELLAKQLGMENVRYAGNLLGNHFRRFANSIMESEREDFFHPINKKCWMREFALYLEREVERLGE